MVSLREGEVLDDLLIDGAKIIQNVNGYRFTSDSVLLSRFARAKAADVVADFCAGCGIVGLHYYLLHRDTTKSVTFFEMQSDLLSMATRSVEYNGFRDTFNAVCCKIQEIPSSFAGKFSLILCNPPYEKGGFTVAEKSKAICRKEIHLTLSDLAVAAAKCLKFGGRLCICHRADRSAEVICTLHENGIEPKRLCFVSGKAKEKPYLVLVEGVRGGKSGVEVLPSIVNQS